MANMNPQEFDLSDIDIDSGIKAAFSTKPAIPIQLLSEPRRINPVLVKKFNVDEYAKFVRDLVSSGDSIYSENIVRALHGQGLSDSQISAVFDHGIKKSYFVFNKNKTIIKSKSSSKDPSQSMLAEEKLTHSQRKELPDLAFAWPEKRKYPIHDASHARNAMARLSAAYKSGKISKKDYSSVRRNILAAYLKFGIKPRKRTVIVSKVPEMKMAADSNVYDVVNKKGVKSKKTRWV